MKAIRLLLLAVALCMSLSVHAGIFQVKQLNTAGSSVILVPGPQATQIIIQNNGSNSVRLSLDGGAGYIDPITQKPGTNPTPTTGYLLPAGQQLIISIPAATVNGDQNMHRPIVAIMVTSTTTLDIITNDTKSIAPTS